MGVFSVFTTMATKVAKASVQKVKYLTGRCVPTFKTNAVKIQIPTYEYNERIHMHFKKFDFVFAHDPNKLCKTGDQVLIQSLPEKMTKLITHKVVEVLMPLGDVTDPITGKKVSAIQYREDVKQVNQIYGESEQAFDYEKAPKRGTLEDKRDFTHKPAYKKYHEHDTDPYAV